MAMVISDNDRKQIDQLRQLVKDQITPYYDTDFNLLRWLVGHDYNIEQIIPKLENHLFMRRNHWPLDTLADKPRSDPIHQHWKNGVTSLSGVLPNVITNIEQSGLHDWWGMLHTHPMNEILKSRVHDLEIMLRKVMELEKVTGERASVVYIMDLGGLAWDRRLPSLLTGPLSALSTFMADHYVELIHSFILVNVPTFISAVWKIAHPLLPDKTRKKVVILGSNWRQEILKYANPNVLPTYWNEEGKEEKFQWKLEQAVPYPVENYYKGHPPSDSIDLFVPAGKCAYFDIDVVEGEELHWEMHADGHFSFGVYIVNPKEANIHKMEKATPFYAKVPGPTLAPIKDFIITKKTGIYRFWFGNTHAWFHQLRITHHINTKSATIAQ